MPSRRLTFAAVALLVLVAVSSVALVPGAVDRLESLRGAITHSGVSPSGALAAAFVLDNTRVGWAESFQGCAPRITPTPPGSAFPTSSSLTPCKVALSIPLDPRVVEWIRYSMGDVPGGYQPPAVVRLVSYNNAVSPPVPARAYTFESPEITRVSFPSLDAAATAGALTEIEFVAEKVTVGSPPALTVPIAEARFVQPHFTVLLAGTDLKVTKIDGLVLHRKVIRTSEAPVVQYDPPNPTSSGALAYGSPNATTSYANGVPVQQAHQGYANGAAPKVLQVNFRKEGGTTLFRIEADVHVAEHEPVGFQTGGKEDKLRFRMTVLDLRLP